MNIVRRELREILRDVSNAQYMIEAILMEFEFSEQDAGLLNDAMNKLNEAEQLLSMVEL
jgi:hypothetical protein